MPNADKIPDLLPELGDMLDGPPVQIGIISQLLIMRFVDEGHKTVHVAVFDSPLGWFPQQFAHDRLPLPDVKLWWFEEGSCLPIGRSGHAERNATVYRPTGQVILKSPGTVKEQFSGLDGGVRLVFPVLN